MCTHLTYLFISNSTTTNAEDSVTSQGKARDVLLFLDRGRLPLMVTQMALPALHYGTFVLFSMDICTLSWHTFLLTTGQLWTLQTVFLLEKKHDMFYYFWICYSLCLHERLKRLCVIVLFALSSEDICLLSVLRMWHKRTCNNYRNHNSFAYSKVVYCCM